MVLAPIYERHAGLFDRAAIDGLQRLAVGDGEDARQARRLWGFAAEAYVERAAVDLTERIATAEATAGIMWRGERIGYRAAATRIADLSDRGERNALETSYLEAVEAINPLRLERLLRMRAATAELGFSDAVEMAAAVHGFDPDALAGELQAFIAASETAYYAALRRYLAPDRHGGGRRIGRRPRLSAAWQRMGCMVRGSRRMLPVATETLGRLGMDVAAQPNVTLDVVQRPNKYPRAFCARCASPGRPARRPAARRVRRLGAMLHEPATWSITRSARPTCRRPTGRVGDTSVTEGYAALLGPSPRAGLARRAHAMTAGADPRLRRLRRLLKRLMLAATWQSCSTSCGCMPRADPANRAYYAGLLGLLTGVHYRGGAVRRRPRRPPLRGRVPSRLDVRGSIVAAPAQRARRGVVAVAGRGRRAHRAWREGQRPSGEDVVARLGYDASRLAPGPPPDPRTRLIGELSGYGGPNITTRAGTRKV